MDSVDDLENRIIATLESDHFLEAIECTDQLDTLLSRRPGFGLDRQTLSVLRADLLGRLFNSAPPRIIADVLPEYLRPLKTAAALALLGLDKTARRYLPRSTDVGSRFSSDTAVRMWTFGTHHHRRIEQMRGAAIANVRTLGIADGSHCDECRKINGRVFAIDDAPALPYDRCTCESGCRCTALAVIED
jgi:hypothetical protein